MAKITKKQLKEDEFKSFIEVIIKNLIVYKDSLINVTIVLLVLAMLASLGVYGYQKYNAKALKSYEKAYIKYQKYIANIKPDNGSDKEINNELSKDQLIKISNDFKGCYESFKYSKVGPKSKIYEGDALYFAKEYDKALKEYDYYINNHFGNEKEYDFNALLGKAYCLTEKEKYKESISVLERIIKDVNEDFSNPLAYQEIAWNYYLLKDYKNSKKYYDKLKTEFPKSSFVRIADSKIKLLPSNIRNLKSEVKAKTDVNKLKPVKK